MTKIRRNGSYDPFTVSTNLYLRRESLRDAQSIWDTDRPPLSRSLLQRRPSLINTADLSDEGGRKSTPGFEDFKKVMEPLAGDLGLIDKGKVRFMGGGTRSMRITEENFVQYTRRVAIAMIGGVSLIAPMLIMVLHPGLVTSLVTTSVFVFAFSLVLVLLEFVTTTSFDVVSATAAYAAVLVVFIGTSGGGSSSS